MLLEAIYHRPKNEFAYAYSDKAVHIRLRTKRDDADHVVAICGDKYDWQGTVQTVEMKRFASDELFDYWQAEAIPPYRRLRYAFGIHSGKEFIWYTERGFFLEKPITADGLFEFPFLNTVDVFEPPHWVKDAVFYQIFPERFANGDSSNDPKGVLPWEDGVPTPDNFFGGDLQGVINHLDHLTELGINAIYFTPVFKATTNHKYDTMDYMQVDPHFGDNDKLKELIQVCHSKGIKVVLDAVFNHSGYWFPPFQDVLEKGDASPYYKWFYVREYPIVTHPRPNYDTFAFEWRMPKLNTENPEVKKYLLDVARYWIKEVGIDGWRLDVANEVDHAFWREFRQVVKEANPEAYILGEIWHDSLPWLQGDQFDAVMNYPVTDAVLDFIARDKIDAYQFANQVSRVQAGYQQQVNEVAFNLLDSHDTPRLLTLVGEDKRKMKLAALIQLAFMGTPCIYYGDEFGMTGGGDPGCRKPMEWNEEKQDRELFGFYQQMIGLRKSHRALRDGSFEFLLADRGTQQVVIKRSSGNEEFIVALNNSSDTATISLGLPKADQAWSSVVGEADVDTDSQSLNITLPPFGWGILKR
jgi:cyclomaltodextrinase